MKKVKRFVLCSFLVFILLNIVAFKVNASSVIKTYSKLINKYLGKMVKIVETGEVTEEMLINRKDNYLLIEISVGKVTTKNKDGKILNAPENANYINYQRVKGAKKGSKIITIFVYDNTRYIDGIAVRLDKIIKK